MMKKLLFVAIALTIIISSCKTSKKGADAAVPVIDTIWDYSFRKVMRDKEIFNATTEVVPLDTVYLSKDTLHLLTKKIVGCDEEDFMLVWNGMMMKSLPPQTSVKLFHRLDPACNERHYFHLTYNITPLRFKQDSVSLNTDSMWSKVTVVRVGGWKNILKYEFRDSKR